jgi:hypothetical protein
MDMKRYSFLIAPLLLIISVSVASSANVTYPNFSSTVGLTLNGNTTTVSTSDGVVLRLTPAVITKTGSAFSSTTINAATFSSYFQFRITAPGGPLFDGNTDPGADGIVFVVQSVSSSIGGGGEGIGYSGILKSVGVEFDTWHNTTNNDPNSNHVGIDLIGVLNHGSGSPNTKIVTTRFDDGHKWHAWVDYNGTDLEVRLNQSGVRPVAALLSRKVNIQNVLGNVTKAYVGFTSGTGSDWGNHDIIRWEYRDTFDPINPPHVASPLPAIMLLLGSGR